MKASLSRWKWAKANARFDLLKRPLLSYHAGMTKKQILLSEIRHIPEPFVGEVLDFVHFLKTKTEVEKRDITLASESSLKKDWNSPWEDKAWKNL